MMPVQEVLMIRLTASAATPASARAWVAARSQSRTISPRYTSVRSVTEVCSRYQEAGRTV